MALFDANDFTRRIVALFPQAWISANAAVATGDPDTNGILASVAKGPGTGLAAIYAQLLYTKLQTRILTSTDVNLDWRAQDYFGVGAFLRGLAESDSAYAARISQRVIAPLPTLLGIQEIAQAYIIAQATANLTEPLALNTEGAIDEVGALDGGAATSAANVVPKVTVFDTQSNPTLAAQVGLIAADAQFCVAFFYNQAQNPAWLLGSSFLGSSTYLGGNTLTTTTPPIAGLGALVNACKAEGTIAIYAANVLAGSGGGTY